VQLLVAWQALWLEIGAALGDDPASERAQALAARWMELSARSGGGAGVKAGHIKAWRDRRNWPDMIKPYVASFKLDQVAEFIGKANAHRLKKRP
jgi:hypothetical protein